MILCGQCDGKPLVSSETIHEPEFQALPGHRHPEFDDCLEWLAKQTKEPYRFYYMSGVFYVHLGCDRDRVLFKLFWSHIENHWKARAKKR